MKKLILIVLLSSCLSLLAQELPVKSWYLGANAGMNLSGLHAISTIDPKFDASIIYNYTEGVTGGLVVCYYSEPRMGVQMELNYSQRGWAEDSDSTTYSRSMEYLEVPFLSHFDFAVKKLNISLTLGPTVSYLLSTAEQSSAMDEDQKKSYYEKEIRNDLEAGLCAGLGVNKYTRNGIIQAEIRFNQALSSIFSKNTSGLSVSQNQAMSLKLSYLFGL